MCICIQPFHFVEASFAAIKVASLLGYVSNGLPHLKPKMLAHLYLQSNLISVDLDVESACEQQFSRLATLTQALT